MTLGIALTAASATWTFVNSTGPEGRAGSGAAEALSQLPPDPPAMILRPLAPAVAIQINDRIKFSDAPNPPARPFDFRGGVDAYDRALTCLTAAIYYESASESEEGQRAVAQVVLNRVRHPAYPASICGVVFQGSTLSTGCQFTFTCDGSLKRARSTREWLRAEAVAAAALAGSVFPTVGHALNYHASFVVPYWATSLGKKAVVGTHIFYRMLGHWGEARAFRRPYAAVEADPITLQAIALAARQRRGGSRESTPKPRVSVDVDPRVELLGVVAMLASRSTANETDTPLITAARANFSPFSNHVAVEIYRQLASKDELLASRVLAQLVEFHTQHSRAALVFRSLALPGQPNTTGAGLSQALAAFARDTNFADFFARQQTHYRSLKEDNLALTVPIVTEFQSYTGMSAGSVRLVVAPMLQHSFVANCFWGAGARTRPLVVLATGGTGPKRKSSAAETARLLVSVLARKAVAFDPCGIAPVRSDCREENGRAKIVQDLIARRLAIGAAPSAGIPPERLNGRDTHLAKVITDALKSYEQNRTWFPTFRDFHPVLMDTLARSQRPAQRPTGALAARLKANAAIGARGRAVLDPVCDAFEQRRRA